MLKAGRFWIWKPASFSGWTSAGPTRSYPSMLPACSSWVRAFESEMVRMITRSTLALSPQ